jgi:outer membrane beta-barrel protein
VHRALLAVLALLPQWALADTDELENPGRVSAVQTRPYRLQHELDLWVSALPLDAFNKGYCAQVGYAVHFTDTFAWQVGRGAYCTSVSTGLQKDLERTYGVVPTTIETVDYFLGSDLLWKPLFGKVAVLNRWVIHGEAFVILGASLFRFTHTFRPAVDLGAGLRIFLNQNVSFRLDLTDQAVIPTGSGTSAGFLNVMTVNLGLAVNFGGKE